MAIKFFKVVLQKDKKKLMLPPEFAVRYGKDLPDWVTLQLPSGPEWEIKLKRRNKETIWLRKGWRELVAHHSIEEGHFLVFKHKGGSVFKVDVFDKTCLSYPPQRGERISKRKREENQRVARHSKAYIIQCKRSLDRREKEKCLRVAREFVSDKPHFRVVMQPSYVIGSRMSLPKQFVREHMRYKECEVTLRRSNGRYWEARFVDGTFETNRHSKTPKLQEGWKFFAKDNTLDVGDVCVFVLAEKLTIDQPELKFDVYIYRAKTK